MKKIIQLISLTAVTAMFQGCAGYNTTMFMTKSNAGLDIDMKPPTAEINISRKEAVIEPAFEKGQTPPVMASFKPNVHFGGALGNYFLGVDQTFAGGDAALTMAMLYADPTPTFVEAGKFDSTLDITNNNSNTNHCWFYREFFTPANPDEIRPFFFGTDTQLGLKVAWSGAGGQFPDTVKAGFNRKEFAWAPITMSQDGKHIKMPSFLATIQSNIGGESSTNKSDITNITSKVSSPRSGGGSVSSVTNIMMNVPDQSGGIYSIQYFATGEAASQLARQKDVRDAMLKRLDPTYSPTTPEFGIGIVAREFLSMMENSLAQLGAIDPVATNFWNGLQNLPNVELPVSLNAAKPPIFIYENTTPKQTNVFHECTTNLVQDPTKPVSLRNVAAYMSKLETSKDFIKQIESQLASNTNGVFLKVDDSTNQVLMVQTNIVELGEQFQIQTSEYDRIQKQLASDKNILLAYSYFKYKYLYLTKP